MKEARGPDSSRLATWPTDRNKSVHAVAGRQRFPSRQQSAFITTSEQ